jgi:hypothetical protein
MRAMHPDELIDIRTQDRLRRDLAIKLGKAVIDAIEGGLQPEGAAKAVKEIWDQEQRLTQSRDALARTYI